MYNNCTIEQNTCIYRFDGQCAKTNCYCPEFVKYDDNNFNNVPCDMVSYSSNEEE